MSAFIQLWRDNPVLAKELRVRMRGARAYWILTGYLAFLSCILFFQYTFWWQEAHRQGHGLSTSSKIGQEFFAAIAAVQAFLVAFITPAVTSGAITIEKEQRTLEMLEMTRLSRVSIVAGKLLSAVSFVALLLISSLPLTSICFFLGGVSPEQVAQSYFLMLAGSFVAGALGMAWSTIARTTTMSVILTYASLLVPFVAVAIYVGVLGMRNDPGEQTMAVCALGLYGIPFEGFGNPSIAVFVHAWDMRHFFGLTLPVWVMAVLTYSLIGLLLAAVATVRLETFPERKGYILRGFIVAIFVQQLFFYFGARFFVFSRSAPPGLSAQMATYPLLQTLFYPALMLLLCVPVFSTGEIRPVDARGFGGYLARGWTPGGLMRSRLNSGLPFLCLLTAIVLGMYCLSFALIGHPRAALNGNVPIPGVVPAPSAPSRVTVNSPNGSFVVPAPPAPAPPSSPLLPAAVALFASIVGLSSLGLLFSAITRNRWAALMLSYATLLVILLIPLLVRANYGANGGSSILMNLCYLNPLMALSELTDVTGSFWADKMLLFGRAPMWQVTTACYIAITLVSLLMATPFVTRMAARRVLPYEDTVARI